MSISEYVPLMTANLNGGIISHVSNLERQGDALIVVTFGNLLRLNQTEHETIKNPYLFVSKDYNF